MTELESLKSMIRIVPHTHRGGDWEVRAPKADQRKARLHRVNTLNIQLVLSVPV